MRHSFPPSVALADVLVTGSASPPGLQVRVAVGLGLGARRVQHGTHAAPEVGIDELAARRTPLPGEVGVIGRVVHVQQEVSQSFGGGKVVDVDEAVGWS